MKKDKDTFTVQESNEIRKLINQKVAANTDEQKRIRDKIRAIGFYITDFTTKKGYTVTDFDTLIKTGHINII